MRFLLANDRTLLAWIRTGLTLQAGGLALMQLSQDASADRFGIILILLGAATALIGYTRYKAADTAIRSGTLPRPGNGPLIEVAIMVGVAVFLCAAYFGGVW